MTALYGVSGTWFVQVSQESLDSFSAKVSEYVCFLTCIMWILETSPLLPTMVLASALTCFPFHGQPSWPAKKRWDVSIPSSTSWYTELQLPTYTLKIRIWIWTWFYKSLTWEVNGLGRRFLKLCGENAWKHWEPSQMCLLCWVCCRW
jgi:hypothetical protein